MKKIIFILLISIIFSCANEKDSEIYIEYINRYNEMIEFEKKQSNQRILYLEEMVKNIIVGRHNQIIPWLENIKKVKSQTDIVIDEIEQIKNAICKNDSINLTDLNKIKRRNYKIKKVQIRSIKQKTDSLKEYFISLIERNSHSRRMIKHLIESLDTEKWNDINGINGKRCNSLELVAILTKIQSETENSSFDIQSYLHAHIDAHAFLRNFWFKPIVEPYEKEVILEDSYYAEIYLADLYTQYDPEIIIGSEKLNIKERKAIYKKQINEDETSLVKEQGFIYFVRYGNDTIKFPFDIEYRIVNK